MIPAVELSSERLMVRDFTEADLSARYVAWLNDPQVVRYSNQRFRRHDVDSSLAYLRSFAGTDNRFFAIHSLGERALIGTMTAYVSGHHATADMGILIGERAVWGQGYGLEAWRLLMGHLLERAGLRKVTGGTLNCNVGMVRIMERSGMHLEAVRKQQEIVAGQAHDILYFAKFRAH